MIDSGLDRNAKIALASVDCLLLQYKLKLSTLVNMDSYLWSVDLKLNAKKLVYHCHGWKLIKLPEGNTRLERKVKRMNNKYE